MAPNGSGSISGKPIASQSRISTEEPKPVTGEAPQSGRKVAKGPTQNFFKRVLNSILRWFQSKPQVSKPQVSKEDIAKIKQSYLQGQRESVSWIKAGPGAKHPGKFVKAGSVPSAREMALLKKADEAVKKRAEAIITGSAQRDHIAEAIIKHEQNPEQLSSRLGSLHKPEIMKAMSFKDEESDPLFNAVLTSGEVKPEVVQKLFSTLSEKLNPQELYDVISLEDENNYNVFDLAVFQGNNELAQAIADKLEPAHLKELMTRKNGEGFTPLELAKARASELGNQNTIELLQAISQR